MILPAFLGVLKSIDLAGNPKDAARFAEADALATQVLGGDYHAWIQLRCLSGDSSSMPEAIRLGITDAQHPCGFATAAARAYAAGKVALVSSAPIAKTATPPTTPQTIGAAAASAPTWVWLLLGLGALVAVVKLVKR